VRRKVFHGVAMTPWHLAAMVSTARGLALTLAGALILSAAIADAAAPVFSTPVSLNSNAAADSGSDFVAQVTTDGAGNWLAVWHSGDSLGGRIGTDDDILVASSADNGETWTAPAALNDFATTDSEWDVWPQATAIGETEIAAVRIEANDRAGLERLLRYCTRPAFGCERLGWDEPGEQLLLAAPQTPPRRPDRGCALSRSNCSTVWPCSPASTNPSPSSAPTAASQMHIIAFITDPASIDRILSHISVPTTPPPIAPAHAPPLWDSMLDQTPLS